MIYVIQDFDGSYSFYGLEQRSFQQWHGTKRTRKDAVYSVAQWNRIRRLLGVLVKLQPLYKVSRTNCVQVCMCVFGDLP